MLDIVPFNFDEVKKSIVDKFIAKGYNADFEGSNASVMADIIAYVVSSMNANTAFNTSEMLLTTATREASVLNLARQQGYEAQGIVSYQYKITLKFKPNTSLAENNTSKRIYELPRYAKFTSGDKSYYYFGDSQTFSRSNYDINYGGELAYVTIMVKEGTLYKFEDYPNSLSIVIPSEYTGDTLSTASYIDIPFTNVEDEGIELYLTYVDEFGVVQYDEEWSRTKQFLIDKDSNLGRRFIRLDDIKLKTPRLYFNIAGVGTVLRLNTEINANVLVSSGSAGIASGVMNVPSDLSEKFAIYDGTDTTKLQTLVITGQDIEDMELVRENAPLFHNSANRAVTKYDYQSIVNRQNVTKFSQVWGGESELPQKLGNIYVSAVPNYAPVGFTSDELNYVYTRNNADNTDLLFLKDTEYRNGSDGIFDVLDAFSVMTILKNPRNPVYIDFKYDIRVVRYSRTTTKQAINQSIFDVVKTYFDNHIEQSESEYFHSNIIKRIDTVLSDTSGITCNLSMDVNIYPQNVEYSLTDNEDQKQVTFYLAIPFEKYIDGGVVDTSVLPNIDTVGFINGNDLIVDFTNMHLAMPSSSLDANPYFYYDIKIGGDICGRYLVMNGSVKFIRIDLFIMNDGGTPTDTGWNTTTLLVSMFDSVKKVTLDYYTDSMKFSKNSFPRLKQVNFLI